MKKSLVIVLASIFVMALVIGCEKGGVEAAKVNGKIITVEDLNDEIESLPAQYKMFAQSPEMKKKILDNLVISELLIQQAERDGILAKPDVQKKIKDYEKSIKTEIETQLYNLKRQKEKASAIAKRETVIKELLAAKDFSTAIISDAEIKQSYVQYAASMKRQDPNAKVEPIDKVKGEIKTSIARQKWLDELKSKANITINENVLGAQSQSIPAMQVQQAQPSGVKVQQAQPSGVKVQQVQPSGVKAPQTK
jgi:hypothetical protein